MWIHPTLKNSAWICLDNVRRIDVNVETENKGSVCGLEFGGGGTPLGDLRCPWGRGCRIPTRQMSFVRPIREGREWVGEVSDGSYLSNVLFSRLAYRTGSGG